MKGLADFVEKEFLRSKRSGEVSLNVNGKPIPLSPFVRDFLTKTIRGMVSALKGCEKSKRIKIYIEGEEK
jgi:hypothetical protein